MESMAGAGIHKAELQQLCHAIPGQSAEAAFSTLSIDPNQQLPTCTNCSSASPNFVTASQTSIAVAAASAK